MVRNEDSIKASRKAFVRKITIHWPEYPMEEEEVESNEPKVLLSCTSVLANPLCMNCLNRMVEYRHQ